MADVAEGGLDLRPRSSLASSVTVASGSDPTAGRVFTSLCFNAGTVAVTTPSLSTSFIPAFVLFLDRPSNSPQESADLRGATFSLSRRAIHQDVRFGVSVLGRRHSAHVSQRS
jgi:hypothetical protein